MITILRMKKEQDPIDVYNCIQFAAAPYIDTIKNNNFNFEFDAGEVILK
jgi:hypothetical protein